METIKVTVDEKEINISNPHKLLWHDAEITKLDYIQYLIAVAPSLLAYTHNRLLTTIRYPDGIKGKSFFQKNIPSYAPEWVISKPWKNTQYIVLQDRATLVWLATQAALEFHISFHTVEREDYPTELVFDLDPMNTDDFSHVCEVALNIKKVLDSLELFSVIKTSGATGLQIYIPIAPIYTFEQTRQLSEFIALYVTEKYPHQITVERLIKNRGSKLYLDYLQHAKGKTLPAPYTTRARRLAPVSTPVTWQEINQGIHPLDFTLHTVPIRIQQKGDLFAPITTQKSPQTLDHILSFLTTHA